MPWSRRREVKKHVICLLAADGTPLRDPVEMCERAQAFYAGLFSQDPANACRVLWDKLPTVSMGDWDRLALPLTLAKFLEALYLMPTNKFLGMDGLTVEFYRMFWDVLVHRLALLPMKGDLCNLRNWHPIFLLGTDYKVIAKAISLRLQSVLADLVHPDQTYTAPGCTIFDNLYLVRDLLELGCRDGLSFTLLSLDQEKVFDWMDQRVSPGAVCFCTVFNQTQLALDGTCELRARSQLYTLAIEPVPRLLRKRLTGLVLHEPEVRLVLAVYANDVLLVVQDLDDLVQVEA
ncbi:unnamed protein product [Eretmochelys imbricata]